MLLRLLSIALIVIGLLGFFMPYWLIDHEHFNVPFGNIEDVERAPDGTIFVADMERARIQKYDAEGRFLKGWMVAMRRGSLCLIIESDSLVSVPANSEEGQIFDFDGNVIGGRPVRPGDHSAACQSQSGMKGWSTDPLGLKITTSSGEDIRIQRPWWHWLAPAPFISLLITFAGFAVSPDIGRTAARVARRKQ